MGLDMYLNKKTYLGFNYEHNREEDGTVPLTVGGKHSHIMPKRVSEIIEQVGYWRKSNAIHAWFVENVQEGKDDCGEYYVSREQLTALLELVRAALSTVTLKDGSVTNGYQGTPDGWEPILEDGQVIDNKEVLENMLPTQGGFFFGGTDYDQYYFQELKETRDILTGALKETGGGEFYYRASW